MQRIQRLIGFEYEMDGWDSIEVDDVPNVLTLATEVPIAKGYMDEANRRRSFWHRMVKGAVLAEEGNLEVTADDAGTESNVELRTKPIDETDANLVNTTAQEVAAQAAALATGYRISWGPPPRGDSHHLLASEMGLATVTTPGSFVKPHLSNLEKMDTHGKVQATTGVRLDQLPKLIENIFMDPNENVPTRGRRKAGRLALAGFDQDTAPQVGQVMQTMGAAPGKAAAAITTYLNGHNTAPAATKELTGLLALLIAYMDMAKAGLVRSYAKTIAPVMARTDFATMFTFLPATDRNYYAKRGGKNFSDLLIAAGYTKKELDKSIFSAGINQSQEPDEWYKDLTRQGLDALDDLEGAEGEQGRRAGQGQADAAKVPDQEWPGRDRGARLLCPPARHRADRPNADARRPDRRTAHASGDGRSDVCRLRRQALPADHVPEH